MKIGQYLAKMWTRV